MKKRAKARAKVTGKVKAKAKVTGKAKTRRKRPVVKAQPVKAQPVKKAAVVKSGPPPVSTAPPPVPQGYTLTAGDGSVRPADKTVKL